jgi:hypothetical protein
MGIYSGGTEIESLFLGGTDVQKVYNGAVLVWSKADRVMIADGTREAPSPVEWLLFAANSQVIMEFDIQISDGSAREFLLGQVSSTDFRLERPSGGLDLSLDVGGAGLNFTNIFSGMNTGDVVHVILTRPAASTLWTAIADNGIVNNSDTDSGPISVSGAASISNVYASQGSREIVSGALWNFSSQDVTTGVLTTIPLNEGSGLNSFTWIDGIVQPNPFVWTPDADWGDEP